MSTAAVHSAASAEWYTPVYIVEAARCALDGPISYDPASCEKANMLVEAALYSTEKTDGLAQSWNFPRVFLNPPTPPRPWWEKFASERFDCGVYVAYSIEALQQIQRWTPGALDDCSVCVLDRRVRFMREVNGEFIQGPSPTHASAIIGRSDSRAFHKRFREAFAHHGWTR